MPVEPAVAPIAAEPAPSRPSLPWRARLAGLLHGAAGGMTVNLLSDDFRYRGLAAVLAGCAVAAAATLFRELPPRAQLRRVAASLVLALALVAAGIAAIGPSSWTGWATAGAAVLTALAVATAADVAAGVWLLFGAALVGYGVSGVGLAVTEMPGASAWLRASMIAIAVSALALGITVLTRNGIMGAVTIAGLAVLGIVSGVAFGVDGHPLVGGAIAATMLAIIAMAMTERAGVRQAALLVAGLVISAMSVILIANGVVLTGVSCLVGAAGLVLGRARLAAGGPPARPLIAVLGVITLAGTGIDFILDGYLLPGVTSCVIALAMLRALFTELARQDAGRGLRSWWQRMTEDPDAS